MNAHRPICLVLCIFLMYGIISQINAEQFQIPHWMRNNAKWWYQDQIQDSEFIKGIRYLVENKIMIMPSTNNYLNKENNIPSWVKNNAGWWANGTISDGDFISGIQYLVNSRIITMKSDINLSQNNSNEQCNKFVTAAETETCLEQFQYDAKITNSMKTTTFYVIGPVTFYYVNDEFQKTDDGKIILTIHFVIRNDSDKEVIMSCQRPDSCNYLLSDGQNKIPYSTNTLVYGSLTLTHDNPKFLDWTFYGPIDPSKKYLFLVHEPWGNGSIPIKIS
jgi:hypothetical protein